MSTAVSIYHGQFGRATLYNLNRPMITHAHREGHLIFHISGAHASMEISGRAVESTPGMACAINPWEPHSFEPGDYEHGALFLVLYIKPIWFLDVGRSASSALRFGRNQIEVTESVTRSVQKVVGLLLEDCVSDMFEGYLYELTQACFDQTWQWTPSRPLPCAQMMFNDFRVRKSINLMRDQIGSEIEFDEIARQSGLSRPHFYKLFRRQTGVTPNLYLNTLRMEQAIENLTTSSKSVTDISIDLGFSSQSGFTRFFSSNVGMAPTEYRRVAHILYA